MGLTTTLDDSLMNTDSFSTSSEEARPGHDSESCRGSESTTEGIRVEIEPVYLEGHSNPLEDQFLFQYRVRIVNDGEETVTLRRRHWVIIDESGDREEVHGDGVIGMQPTLRSGESFEYESHCPLGTRWGTMEGIYEFERESDGETIEAEVARFYLVAPKAAAVNS